ncbi:tryptophan-rich sensory protein [Rubrivirga sp. IMCC45206]|uniref:tryptophan-rich sensory protein n=1 Tax=Rubrivirga sp. IMCC45206 TaxID=3391614 RepID=UPI00398F90DC
MHGRLRQLVVVVAAALNLVLNGLAGAGLLFGVQTGAVSDVNDTPITPPGWAFGIWSVIFVGVAVFAVWQALPAQRGARIDRVAGPFVLANVLNGLWQIPWLTGRFGLAALVIVGILASLVALYVRLDRLALRGAERWALGVPTALWLAWLAVATPLNLTVWLRSLGWTADAIVWPIVVIVAVGAVGAWWLSRTADLAAALVLGWAFAAIGSGVEGALLAAVGAAALAVLAGLGVGARRQSLWPTAHAS